MLCDNVNKWLPNKRVCERNKCCLEVCVVGVKIITYYYY